MATPGDPDDHGPPARAARTTGRRFGGAIVRRLGTAILSGAYGPGDTLSTEHDSSEELEISRGTYREAIRVLAAKGLVESRPKAGTRVLPRHRWNLLDPQVLEWAFAGDPDEKLVAELFELRAIVEPAAAALAAARRTQDDLERMADALLAMERHGLAREEGQAADRAFHGHILRATGNDALVVLSSSIEAAVRWTTRFKQRARALPRDPVPDHRTVYAAVQAADAGAARDAMHRLVELALDDTRRALGG